MRILRSLFLLLGLTVLSACATNQVTDFSNRSIGYAWVNLDEANGNRVIGGSFRNLGQPRESSISGAGVEKMGNGFLIYQFALLNGPNKLSTVDTMFCIGLCGNTINVYDFGAQGSDVAAVNIRSRGAYNFGNYAIVTENNGWFGPRRFDVQRTSGPSKRQILTFLMSIAPEQQKPLIQAELNRL